MSFRSYLARLVLGRELADREQTARRAAEAAREQSAVLAETSPLLGSVVVPLVARGRTLRTLSLLSAGLRPS